MKPNDILNSIRRYKDKWNGKYLRNLRLYTYSMNVSLDDLENGDIIGYWSYFNQDNYTTSINENIIQSCVDSLVSQLSAKNTRPFLSTYNATYNETKATKQVQQRIDDEFDKQYVIDTVTSCARNACIFGKGYIVIDENKIESALPWQIYYKPSEETYGKIKTIAWERKYYPSSLIDNYKGKSEYVNYTILWDINTHKKYVFIDNKLDATIPYDYDEVPVVIYNYLPPIKGRDTISIPDMLYGIQMKLDDLYATISEAIRLNPAQTFVVPEGSDIKVTSLNNEVGQILQYKPIPEVSSPVTSVTPSFIAEQYFSTVQTLKNDAYELVGISKLTAQSIKPNGVDSGVALKTMNDIESERFEVQMRQFINTFTKIAKIWIMTQNDEDTILPFDNDRLAIKWGDFKTYIDRVKIQFSNLDYLSKDPTTKLQQINTLVQMGIIAPGNVAKYLNFPDIDAATNFATNSENAIMTVIDQAIASEDYNIPDYIPLDALMTTIVNTMLSLKSVENEQNAESIIRLQNLYNNALQMKNNLAQLQSQNEEAQWQMQLQREAQQIVNTNNANAQSVLQNTNNNEE